VTQTPDSGFAVELRPDPAGVTAAVTGDIDLATAASLAQTVRNAIYRADDRLLTLDLAGVGFCDSVGISALVDIREACADLGWRLRLVGLQPNVRRMIVDFTGLGEYLDVQ
jgi:anti-sigma B factor antagonist